MALKKLLQPSCLLRKALKEMPSLSLLTLPLLWPLPQLCLLWPLPQLCLLWPLPQWCLLQTLAYCLLLSLPLLLSLRTSLRHQSYQWFLTWVLPKSLCTLHRSQPKCLYPLRLLFLHLLPLLLRPR